MPLPTPKGRQKEVLVLPAEGHHVVLGTAGSGKTVLAILRSTYLADSRAAHAGRTLLVTFNRTLVAYLKHLRDTRMANVRIENYHTFARGYLGSRGLLGQNVICTRIQRDSLIRQAQAEALASAKGKKVPELETVLEEVRWIAQHGIGNKKAYIESRSVSLPELDEENLAAIMRIHERYKALRLGTGKEYDWDDIAGAVVTALQADKSSRMYRHVVVDEGQDFSPMMIRSLALAVPANGSVTLFGDAAQQIYGRHVSWRSAGLTIKEPWLFEQNYRNSKQVAKLALAISGLPFYKGVADIVAPQEPAADGPLPTLVRFNSEAEEIKFVVREAEKAGRNRSVGILVRTHHLEQLIASKLKGTAERLHREMSEWSSKPGVHYGTYHAGKGLEFDTVILPFLGEDRLPDPTLSAARGTQEASAQDIRLLYVGVTRARSVLVLTATGTSTPLLPKDGSLYTTVTP